MLGKGITSSHFAVRFPGRSFHPTTTTCTSRSFYAFRAVVRLAKERQVRRPESVRKNSATQKGRAKDKAAEAVGISRDTAEKLYILSGSRRWVAANKLGITDVPVRKADLSALRAEQFLIESNRQRLKTPSQLAQEYKELTRIEEALAKERLAAGGNKKEVGRQKSSNPGRAKDKAAKAVGISRDTAEKLSKIRDAADAGDPEAKEQLALLDNDKTSIAASHEYVLPDGPIFCHFGGLVAGDT